ncbi:polysaccharide deacetylase family protein [Oceanirhabdus seepicola]|uniref:Polysaccharide deacetylase n=1 Tax=Oceanirhabdus seepicola TaxID=2828781 RepID=A0A9J6NX63_9CLOT|nr:polysaccharide deacetylase family protein [Oceanirhabdus seepicola]MCM1988851.1 polysaccharide deacetylase [Oceanirhabdus seepicola]
MKFSKVLLMLGVLIIMIFNVNTKCIKCEEVQPELSEYKSNIKKKAFLTFDDGPSPEVTLDIIKVLKKNQVKGSFFIIGSRAEEYPHIIEELVNNEMSVCIHSYSHKYEDIYKSVNDYIEDLKKCEEVIKKHVKGDVSRYVRMPGGSFGSIKSKAMLKEIKEAIVDNDFKYIDWNVPSDDTQERYVSQDLIFRNIKKNVKGKNTAIILMHDSKYKKTSAKVLQRVIDYLREEGYEFYCMDDITEEDEMLLIKSRIINNGVGVTSEFTHIKDYEPKVE